MAKRAESPRITGLSWGNIEVEGYGRFKDVKVWPGGAREWDWRETGTDHKPGIQPGDVEELLDHDARVIVLAKGINERLGVEPDTIQMLKDKGVTVHVLQTEEAVRRYNEIRGKAPVAGLFHSTC